MNKFFNFFRKTLKRADVIITILLLALIALLVWFIVTGFSQSVIIVSIGIAAISALFAAFSSFANLLQAF
jgi:low affinity Fe/Cu permease